MPYVCYIDEAGCPGALPSPTSNVQPALVLVGLILEAGAITTATNAFLKLKRAYFSGKLKSAHLLDDLLVEVKGSDIRSAIRKRGVKAAAESNTPSMTTQWKCRWALRLEPKQWMKATAPRRPAGLGPGLCARRQDSTPRRNRRRAAP